MKKVIIVLLPGDNHYLYLDLFSTILFYFYFLLFKNFFIYCIGVRTSLT